MIARITTFFDSTSFRPAFLDYQIPAWANVSGIALALVLFGAHILLINYLVAAGYEMKSLQTEVVKSENQLAQSQAQFLYRTPEAVMASAEGAFLKEIGSDISYVFGNSLFVDASGVVR